MSAAPDNDSDPQPRPTTPPSPVTPVTPSTPSRPTKSAARGTPSASASTSASSSAIRPPTTSSSMKRVTSAFNRPEPDRLLSVQSHVVSGYVGNRSATFPLQLLGWDVDVINTVQFSNHTGYGRWKGLRFDEDHVRSLFAGLEENGLMKQSRMLSGYMPSPGVVSAVHDAVRRIRQLNPDLIYLCDPVMGDMGRGMYVDPNVLPIYRSMLPLTTIITPNQFEAQSLAEKEITSRESLVDVLETLHNHGATHVLITSVELPPQDMASIGADPDADTPSSQHKSMILVGSSRQPGNPDEPLRPWFIQFPEIQGYFSGVGDLFAAMTLGRFLHGEGETTAASTTSPPTSQSITPIAHAAEVAIAAVQAVLVKTLDAMGDQSGSNGTQADAEVDPAQAAQERVETMRRKELRIVQSRREIESPTVRYRARFFADA